MYVSVNRKGEIKEVGVSTDPNLTALYIDESVDRFPFEGWSNAKICCYKVRVVDGVVMMLTPYIDSRLLDNFDMVGKATEENAIGIEENTDAILETYENGMETNENVSALEDTVLELYEMILGESEVE